MERRNLAFLKKHGAHFDEKYLWDSLRPIIPYPTGRFFGGTLSQALRAWLRSCCPSGTKTMRLSKRLAAPSETRRRHLAVPRANSRLSLSISSIAERPLMKQRFH